MKHQQDNKQPPPMPCCSVTYQLWLNQQKTSNNGKTQNTGTIETTIPTNEGKKRKGTPTEKG